MSTKIVFPGTPVCVCIYPAERICSGWTDLESWLTAERLERLTRLPLLWTDRADVERDSRRGPDRFWSANPRYLHRANSITLPPVQTCFREHLSLSPSVCVACSSICRSEDTEADVSQAGACLEHFQWGGHAGALPPNGVATSDQKKKS